jgi:transcription antitermination factor NusG
MDFVDNNLRWYALHVRSRFERVVARNLEGKGIEGFLPLYRTRHRWSDRVKEIELPLFPGYVFCRLDIRDRLPVLTIPGVHSVVGVAKQPLPVDECQLNDIRSLLSSGLSCEPWPFLAVGQTVRIENGALAGVQGTIVSVKNQFRLVISVHLLQRAVAVEIDRESVSLVSTSAKEDLSRYALAR